MLRMEPVAAASRPRLRRRRCLPDDLVVAVVSEHAESLLRVARRYTDCAADAEDAYQRAMEIFVRSAHRLDPASAHRWLHTVLKHECYAVTQARGKLVGVEDEEALGALDDGRCAPSVEERAERFDDLAHAAEALRRLKPAEVTALVLKAQGLSYREIAERQGWTYTKVNRCLTEGRRAFLDRYAGIRAGEECARWEPTLSAMADGEAAAKDVVAIRPHLRNCPSCRAMLAAMQRAPSAAAAVVPVGAATGSGLLTRLVEWLHGLGEPVLRLQPSFEAAGAAKVAAVAASAAAIAGGGVAVHQEATASSSAPAAAERAAETTAAASPPAAKPAGEPLAPLEHRPEAAATATIPREAPRAEPARRPDDTAPSGAEFAAELPGGGEAEREPSPFGDEAGDPSPFTTGGQGTTEPTPDPPATRPRQSANPRPGAPAGAEFGFE